MIRRIALAAAVAAAPLAIGGAAIADPGDEWRKQFEIRADCDKKLAEADSRRKYREELRVCNRKLAEWSAKQREEAFKARQEAEKKWRERRFGDDDD